MNAYRDAVLEIVTRERDDALHRLDAIAAICREADPYENAYLTLIRNILNLPNSTSHRQEH